MGDVARWRAWLRERPLAADTLLAVALFCGQAALLAAFPWDEIQTPWQVQLGLVAIEMGFVAIRRRWPWLAVLGVAALANASALLLPPGEGGAAVGFIVISYTAAAYLRLLPAVLAALILWVPALIGTLLTGPPPMFERVPSWYFVLTNGLVAATSFFIGRVVHTRRAYIAALEGRAEAAEANQQALAAQAVADERRRIARELHDVVAHHVAVMGVLATGARRAAGRDPAAADEALATIEQTGRTVLREMRRLLDVLRSDTEPASELAPQPGLTAVEALVEQVREAGLPVTLTINGDPGSLDTGVALAAYRVVQEALTNVLKHAGHGGGGGRAGNVTAEVRIARRDGWLQLEVFDTGRGPAPDGDQVGHGLVSMRERVHLLGGTLRAGPRPGGGFRVYARIPTDHHAEPPT